MKAPAILVVDDDVDTCRNLCDILTDVGYRVDTAHDGLTALELVRMRHYDVALMDLKMPGMDGLTLYREIKNLCADTVGVIVTAYASQATTEEAATAGVWQVLPKPIDLSKLLPLVDEAAEQPLILIVDDDRDLCANLWDLLREKGYRVGLAAGVPATTKQLIDRDYRVVLIDMKLPEGDGKQVFELVRRMNPLARTVLITGFRSETEEQVRRVLAEGADGVCYKPFDVPKLLGTVETLIHHSDSPSPT